MSLSRESSFRGAPANGGFGLLICFLGLFCASLPAQQLRGPDAHPSGLRASLDAHEQPQLSVHALSPEERGDLYMARKMYRDAVDAYRRAPINDVIYNRIGIAFQQMLRFDLAAKNYEQALKLNSHYAEAMNNLGTAYYGERFFDKAIKCYKHSLKFSGPVASTYANLGAAYFARHDYKRASENFSQAFKMDPDILERRSTFGTRIQEGTATDLATFHFYLAKSYAERGSKQRALLYLRKALEEGLKNRKKLPEVPEFGSLRNDPEFRELLVENPRPL